MLLEPFFPDINTQVFISICASLWVVMVMKGHLSQATDMYFVPDLYNITSCKLVLQATPPEVDDTSITITMATKYNETNVFKQTNISLMLEENYEIDWNFSKGAVIEASGKLILIFPNSDSTLDIISTRKSGSVFMLGANSALFNDFSLRIYSFHDMTTVNISQPSNHTFSSSESYTNKTMQFQRYENQILNFPVDGGIYLKSDQPIALSLESASETCNVTNDIMTAVVPVNHFDSEYLISTPKNMSGEVIFVCELFGEFDGNVQIWDSDNNTESLNLTSFQTSSVNLTGRDYVYVSSSVDIGVFCNAWITTEIGTTYRNSYFIPPLTQLTPCLRLNIQNCSNTICVVVVSHDYVDVSLEISSSAENLTIPSTLMNLGKKNISVWEIGYIQDGIYQIGSRQNILILVYKSDPAHGRYYPMDPTSCYISNTNTKSSPSESVSNFTHTESFLSNSSLYGASNSTTTTPVNPISLTNRSSILSLRVSIANQNGSLISDNQTFAEPLTSGANLSASSDADLMTKYAFLYEEIPEDDKILNDYMVAVIASLGTAIFGVVGLISGFLLVEILARRKQLGNSKIRPMVS